MSLQVVSNLTYHRMAMHEGVDTHTLRKALWNYIHCLYGIRSVSHAVRNQFEMRKWVCLFCLCCCASLNVLSLHLCSYDDYDYGSVNVLLERSLKVFVKTMACHPEQTTARVYHAFWRHFRHSEKVGTSSDTTWAGPFSRSDSIIWHFNTSFLFGTFSTKNESFDISARPLVFLPFLNVIREASITDGTSKCVT